MSAAMFFERVRAHAPDALLVQVAEHLREVEVVLHQLVKSEQPLVQQVGEHTLDAGGKRLRPAFLSLAAQATGLPFDRGRAIRLGACLELIHMATLIHDDVIDHADLRRGRPTAASVFGNTPSILSGDVFLAKAMSMLAEDGDLRIIRTVASSVVEIAEGEVRELATRGAFDLEIDEHFAVLRMKTASFVECCCRVGALVADAPAALESSLSAYGHHVGMAFQIADDLLNFRGDLSATGKPWATDFREGCATLPLIFLRAAMSAEESAFAKEKFGNGVSDEDLRVLTGWMESRGAWTQSEAAARREAEQAITAIADLPDGDTKALLEGVAELIVSRNA